MKAARLGWLLVVLVGAAWATGLPYLAERLGVPAGIPLDRLDLPHAYLGLAAAGVLLVKVIELHHLRRSGPATPNRGGPAPWQRWLSRSLGWLYGAVLVSGLLLIPAWPATVRSQLVELHLLSATWAAVATAVHAWAHVRHRIPGWRPAPRLAGTAALLAIPALVAASVPVAFSPLAQLGAGGDWSPVGPRGLWTDRLLDLGSGNILAAGDGIWSSRDGGATWSPAGAGYIVLALCPGSGRSIYAGLADGLLEADSPAGPYRRLAVPAAPVNAIFWDAADGGRLWIGGAGVWTSADGGLHWTPAAAGMIPSGHVLAIGRFGGVLLAGTSTGVYRFSSGTWTRQNSLPEVVALDNGGLAGGVWASSMGGGLAVDRGQGWTASDAGMAVHGGAVHVTAFVPVSSRRELAGLMRGGVVESLDGGTTWAPLTPGFSPGPVWQLSVRDGWVLAATDSGLFRYRLER